MIGPSAWNIWGWPWHGLCTGGTVAGYSVTQPGHGSAWLLDLGLPAISLTADETTDAAAQGYTWLNYAMISGGRLYDTYLGDNTFIHVDEAGECWLVTLSYSVPSANTVRVAASVVRFGLFGHGADTPVSLSPVDVTCDHIEITAALGNPVGTYSGRTIALEDVWTNGAKALLGVVLWTSGGGAVYDLFSVIEISLSGTGGATGSGLSLTGTEVLGQDELTVRYQDNGVNEGIDEGTGIGLQWYDFHFASGGMSLVQDYYIGNQWARTAYYNTDGNARALILRVVIVWDHWITSTSGESCVDCTDHFGVPGQICEGVVTVSGVYSSEISLYSSTDQIDSLTSFVDISGTQRQMFNKQLVDHPDGDMWGPTTDLCRSDYFWAYQEYEWADPIFTGSLSSLFDAADAPGFNHDSVSDLILAWRAFNPHVSDATVLIGSVRLGLQRLDAKSAALYKTDSTPGARTYGTISTPLGTKTYSGSAPSSNLYFAWQRKTGDFSFSTAPICYV